MVNSELVIHCQNWEERKCPTDQEGSCKEASYADKFPFLDAVDPNQPHFHTTV